MNIVTLFCIISKDLRPPDYNCHPQVRE